MSEASYEPYVPGRPLPEDAPRKVRRTGCGSSDDPAGPSMFVVSTVICVGIWLMTGAGYFWPMWVMLGTGIPVVLGGLARLDDSQRSRGVERSRCGR